MKEKKDQTLQTKVTKTVKAQIAQVAQRDYEGNESLAVRKLLAKVLEDSIKDELTK